MPDKQTCQSCRWWKGDEEPDVPGPCVRFPPKYVELHPGDSSLMPTGVFPTTEAQWWCGEWTPREGE